MFKIDTTIIDRLSNEFIYDLITITTLIVLPLLFSSVSGMKKIVLYTLYYMYLAGLMFITILFKYKLNKMINTDYFDNLLNNIKKFQNILIITILSLSIILLTTLVFTLSFKHSIVLIVLIITQIIALIIIIYKLSKNIDDNKTEGFMMRDNIRLMQSQYKSNNYMSIQNNNVNFNNKEKFIAHSLPEWVEK